MVLYFFLCALILLFIYLFYFIDVLHLKYHHQPPPLGIYLIILCIHANKKPKCNSMNPITLNIARCIKNNSKKGAKYIKGLKTPSERCWNSVGIVVVRGTTRLKSVECVGFGIGTPNLFYLLMMAVFLITILRGRACLFLVGSSSSILDQSHRQGCCCCHY